MIENERTVGCITCKEKSGILQRKGKSDHHVRQCIRGRAERG